MKLVYTVLVFIFCSSCTQNSAIAPADLPEDVNALIERRDWCNHYSTEISDAESERNQAMQQEMATLDCESVDVDLSALSDKYKNDKLVQRALRE